MMFIFLITGAFVINRITFSANDITLRDKSTLQSISSRITPEPTNTPPSNAPPQTMIRRIKLLVGETRDVPVLGTGNLVTVVSPEIASAQIKNGNILTITGIKIGETILIIYGDGIRQTLIAEVAWKAPVSKGQNSPPAQLSDNPKAKISGSYNVAYAQDSQQSPALIKNRFELHRKLSKDRTLRVAAEMYNFFGGDQKKLVDLRNYELGRISVGVDAPGKTIDLLDSRVQISPLTANNFEMRGFHLSSASKTSKAVDSGRQGIEVFAGLAGSAYDHSNKTRAKIAGALLPVASGDTWQIRAGFLTVSQPKNNKTERGGTAFNLDASFAPNQKFSADGEMSFAGGAFSWGGRLNIKFKTFGASGEIDRTDKNSPGGSLGAYSGGRRSESFSAYWRPGTRLNFSGSYNRTDISRATDSGFVNFNRTTYSVGASYRARKNSRLNLSFLDQQIEVAVPGSSTNFKIATRTFSIGHNIRFNEHLSNDFEARLNFSREAKNETPLDTGFNLRDQLRFSWGGNSLTGFFNYTTHTPSLTSLIIRNPQLLPPDLQAAFILDPSQFLQIYRDRLAFLLPSLELPVTSNMNAGIRFQKVVSRLTLTGEARYGANSIYLQNQNNLFTSFGVDFRLDAANSLQINGLHTFGAAGGGSGISFGFTHRFGAGSGGGFQFSNLLGLNKGKIRGRVYYDLNGNGQDDRGEPGVSGLTVKLNDKRSVKTNAEGRYEFSANEGRYDITIISEELGVRLRATTATQQAVALSSGQTVNLSFGLSSFGFVSGRVFNDSGSTGESSKSNFQGIGEVKLILHSLEPGSENFVVEQLSSNTGTYEFHNLRPGNYRLEIDSATLPPNFLLPKQSSREITVLPLQGFYLDIPLTAQRAIAGIVFIDQDGNGKFDPPTDEPVEGASVTANEIVSVSDRNGAYLLRDLPAGKIQITINTNTGAIISPIFIELGPEPVTVRAVNFVVKR
jgi:hypothetical protein